MRIVILIFIIAFSAFAQLEFKDETLCKQISAIREQHEDDFENMKKVKKQLVLSQFFPRRYFRLEQKSARQDLESTKKQIGNSGIILSIGSDQASEQEKKDFKERLKAYQKINKKFSKLLKAKSIEKCLKIKKRIAFNYQDLENSKQQLQSLKSVKQWQEYQQAIKGIKKLKRKSKISWEIKFATTKEDIRQALISGEYQHVVTILHAKDNGFLVDNDSNILPASIFKYTHPNVKSLFVMSCYSDEVNKKYSLLENFLTSKNNYLERKIFTPRSKLAIQDNRSILKLLPFYLKKANKLEYKKVMVKSKYEVDFETCTMKLNSPIEGKIDLFINDKLYIGSLHMNNKTLQYPCSLSEGAKFLSVRPSKSHPPQFDEMLLEADFNLELKKHFYFGQEYNGSMFTISR